MESGSRYCAFISYSHHDRRVARWLRDQLVATSVPGALRDRLPQGSRRLAPIFFDDSEARASPSLEEELRSALRDSQCLVVVCSPFAVASEYVNAEIAYFKSLGRAGQILCVVASGVPNATDSGRPALECFPAALRFEVDAQAHTATTAIPLSQRPLAAALGEETRADQQRVLRQLTCGLLRVTPEELRRTSSAPRAFQAAAALLVLGAVGAAAGWYQWAYRAPHRTAYRAFVRQWGRWEGVDALPLDVPAEHYEFLRHGALGRVDEVRLLNGSGACPSGGLASVLGNTLSTPCSSERACSARFAYSESGELVSEQLLSHVGAALETVKYTGDAVGVFVEGGFGCARTRSGVEYLSFKRNQAGFDQEVRFIGADRRPRPNHDGVFGFRFQRDERGRVLEQVNLDAAGGRVIDVPDRVAARRFTYDARGDLVRTDYEGLEGTPVYSLGNCRCAAFTAEYDEHGNEVRQLFLDLDGGLTLSQEGVVGWSYSRDEHGNVLRGQHLGLDGGVGARTSGNATWEERHDERGSTTLQRELDARGQPVEVSEGHASWAQAYDAFGNLRRTDFFGLDGGLTRNAEGYASTVLEVDERGRMTGKRFLDVDGGLVLNAERNAGLTRRYDARGFFAEEGVLGLDGGPGFNRNLVAGTRLAYDERGNETARDYFGVDGRPALHRSEMAGSRVTYDEYGHMLSYRTVGLDGGLAVDDSLCVEHTYRYDALGWLVEVRCRDGMGRLTLRKDGTSGWDALHDSRGNDVEYHYAAIDGGLAVTPNGAAGWRVTLDERGRRTRFTWLGADLSPVTEKSGYTTERYTLDARGWRTQVERLGLDGGAVLTDGVAGWRSTFDERGRETARVYFGLKGERVRHRDGHGGWRSTFDARGHELRRDWVDEHDAPVLVDEEAGYVLTVDDRGRLLTRRSLGLDGGWTQRKGVAETRSTWDAFGDEVRGQWLGLDGGLFTSEGVAEVRTTYTPRGQLLTRERFNAAGEPSLSTVSGRFTNVREYDDAGRFARECNYDTKHALVNLQPDGWACRRRLYAADGHAETDEWTDAAGKLLKRVAPADP